MTPTTRSLSLLTFLTLALASCGGGEDPSTPSEGEENSQTGTNNAATPGATVTLLNPSVTVIDEHRSCRAGNMSRDDCYSYGVTFVLVNNSTEHAIDRLSSVRIEVGNGDLVVDAPITCKEHPWTVPPSEQTSVIEVQYIANTEGFFEDIEVRLPCGSIDRLEETRVIPEPFSAGTASGTLTLKLTGIMADASPWEIEQELTF